MVCSENETLSVNSKSSNIRTKNLGKEIVDPLHLLNNQFAVQAYPALLHFVLLCFIEIGFFSFTN